MIFQILSFGFLAQSGSAWTPGTASPTAPAGLSVDTTDRRDTLAFYQCMYKASESYAADMAWTGNVATGVAGTTSTTFKDHVRRRINFYRAMAGLPGDITFSTVKSSKDQLAALMFSRNVALSHSPPASWVYYTADGAEAAANSNIAYGSYGPLAVDNYMEDFGAGNEPVGHRRWLMYSRAQEMGTGDIPRNGSYQPANAIWGIGDFKAAPPASYTKWPNAGYSPVTLVPARWSLSYPGANFTNATVSMTRDGISVASPVISKTQTGVGDNSIVWEPAALPATAPTDTTYQVTVSGIVIGGTTTSHSYSVTLFDPENLGEVIAIQGSSTPPILSSTYTFNSIEQADSYELLIGRTAPSSWTEGAEDSTASFVTPALTGYTTLRQTARKRSGTKAFQLTFPDNSSIVDQSFSLTREMVPTAASSLQFYQLAQATGASDAFSAQVSTSNGASWTTVWSRTGTGGSTAQTSFQSVSISLAAYAGQLIKIRFLLEYKGGSTYLGTASNTGFFVDDISISGGSEIISKKTTLLPSSATAFALNSSTAGNLLLVTTSYVLTVRPQVGTQWFAYGPVKVVTARALTGLENWLGNLYPTLTGGLEGDDDQDGITNLLEYAFGLNPLTPNPSTALPQPVVNGGTMTTSFQTPEGVTDIVYGVQWSTNLVDWNNLTDTGTGMTHTFSVSTTGKPRLFFRLSPSVAP